MRIMYFAFEGFDNPNGTNHLALEMIDFFLEHDIEVYLLTSHSTGLNPDIPEVLKKRKGFTYNIVNRKVVNKANFAQRYLDGLQYAFRCKKYWKKELDNLDLIILQSTPTIFISSILLHLGYNKPVLYNSYDIFPDGPYAYGAISNKTIYWVLKRLQKFVYNYSHKIIVISEDMKRKLVIQGIPKNKLVKINNWFDDKKVCFVPFKQNEFVKKYNLSQDVFYVQYAGNFGYTFNYKLVLEVATILQNENNIIFQMIGSGVFEQAFKKEAVGKKLSNIIFYPWQHSELISDVYSACNLAFIPLSQGVMQCSYPSKGALLMACGKTIVCATEIDTDYFKVMNGNKIGICVSNKSAKECADAILTLYHDRDYNTKIGNNAQEFADSELSSSVNLKRFMSLLNSSIEETIENNKNRSL